MKKLAISLSIFSIFAFLLIIGGCQEGGVLPSTPTFTPTFTPTALPTSTPTIVPTPTNTPLIVPLVGSVSGIVKEKGTDTPLEGVTITVDDDTTTTTASDGSYVITNLSPGTHTLRFEKVGYKGERADVSIVPVTNTHFSVELENTKARTMLPVDADTYIYSGCEVKGEEERIKFGAIASAGDVRMLFNFSNLPSDKKIISAKLRLYKISSFPLTIPSISYIVYTLTEYWDENCATWEKRFCGSPSWFDWFVPGGTYNEDFKVTEGVFNLGGGSGWETIDITKAYDYWHLREDLPGIIVKLNKPTTGWISFASKEYPNFEMIPYVDMEYYTP